MDSIKKKMTAIILIVVLIPFITYSLVNHFLALKNIEKQVVSSNADLNSALAGTITEFFDKTFNATAQLAESAEIISMNPETQKKILEDTYKRNNFFRLIFVADKNGAQIARSTGLVNTETYNRFWFIRMKKELHAFTSEAYFSDKDNKVVVSEVYPIISKDELSGVLIAEVNLSSIKDKLKSFVSKKDAVVYIIDDKGNVVFRSNNNEDLTEKQNLITKQKTVLIIDSNKDVLLDKYKNQSERLEPLKISDVLSIAAREAVSGENGSKIFFDGKTKKLLCYKPIRVNAVSGNWAILVEEDYNQAMSFALSTLRNSIVATVVQLLILLLLSFYISKLISTPMTIITDGVRAIKNGRLEYRINIKGNDEFAEMGGAFNEMATNLMESYEQQIRKNRELKGINMEMEESNRQLLVAIKQLNETEGNLRSAFKKTVQGLISAVEAKDLYTESHSIRVANYSVVIAEKMGYSTRKKEDLWIAGVLHDIGKIGITDLILNKVGKLTQKEYNEIKQHPVIACKMLSKIDLSREIMEAIRYHHEKFDGSGYPDNLPGKEIPEMAAIISVADAFDAITSTRAYRESRTLEEGIDEIVSNAGTQFKIEVVSALLNLYNENSEIIEKIHNDDNIEMPI